MITLNCKKCKKEFKIYQSRIKVGKGKFCSRSCSNSVNGIGNTRAVGNTAWVGRTLCVSCHRKTNTYGRVGIFKNITAYAIGA